MQRQCESIQRRYEETVSHRQVTPNSKSQVFQFERVFCTQQAKRWLALPRLMLYLQDSASYHMDGISFACYPLQFTVSISLLLLSLQTHRNKFKIAGSVKYWAGCLPFLLCLSVLINDQQL